MKHPCDIYRVARQCGVILREGFEHSPTSRKPRECFCKPTLREIGQEHGEDHLRLVFRLMLGSPSNAAHLYADVVKAVSSLIAHHPEIERISNLAEIFDEIDIGEIRRLSRYIGAMPVWQAAYVLLFTEISIKTNASPAFWDYNPRYAKAS